MTYTTSSTLVEIWANVEKFVTAKCYDRFATILIRPQPWLTVCHGFGPIATVIAMTSQICNGAS